MRYLFIAVLLSTLAFSCSRDNASVPAPATAKSDLDLLKEELKSNPQDAEKWFHLSEIFERGHMYQEQIDALKHAVAVKPDMGYAYFKLGTACNRVNQYEDAVKNFTKATRYIPKQPMLYNNMAISYGKLGKTDEEIAALKKAISIRPTYAIARFNLGMVSVQSGGREEAMKQYRELRKLDEGLAATLKKEIDTKRKRR